MNNSTTSDKEFLMQQNICLLSECVASLAVNVAKLIALNETLGVHNQSPMLQDLQEVNKKLKKLEF